MRFAEGEEVLPIQDGPGPNSHALLDAALYIDDELAWQSLALYGETGSGNGNECGRTDALDEARSSPLRAALVRILVLVLVL